MAALELKAATRSTKVAAPLKPASASRRAARRARPVSSWQPGKGEIARNKAFAVTALTWNYEGRSEGKLI